MAWLMRSAIINRLLESLADRPAGVNVSAGTRPQVEERRGAVSTVKIEGYGKVAVVRLDNGVTNAVGNNLVEDLSKALKKVKEEFNGLVLAGGTKFFCLGLNLPELLELDRAGMSDFWHGFNQVNADLYTLPLPTACAVAGHAPAAGTVFMLDCDFRIATSERKMIGLNEVKLGLPVPYLTTLILGETVSNQAAIELLYRGEFVEPGKAAEIGLVDGVVDPDQVEEVALQRIQEIAALPHSALAAIKSNRVEAVASRFEQNRKEREATFIDCWFDETTQKLLRKAAEKF
jgi:enoyl-CoA hydratase/carnithine racemase